MATAAPVKKPEPPHYTSGYMRVSANALKMGADAKDKNGHYIAMRAHTEAMIMSHKAGHAEQTEYHRKQSNIHAQKYREAGDEAEATDKKEKDMTEQTLNEQFGERINPARRLPSGTKVQINRPSHPNHKMVGTVISHGPTHVTVQHNDGSRSDHPVSVVHHATATTGAKPTFEQEVIEEAGVKEVHINPQPGKVTGWSTVSGHASHKTAHLSKVRKLEKQGWTHNGDTTHRRWNSTTTMHNAEGHHISVMTTDTSNGKTHQHRVEPA